MSDQNWKPPVGAVALGSNWKEPSPVVGARFGSSSGYIN